MAFRLTWYKDVSVGPEQPYSEPGFAYTNVIVGLAYFGMQDPRPGVATESYYCTVTNKTTDPGFEHEYEYYVVLEEPWLEKDRRVYWLSIEALYPPQLLPPELGMHPWGWKTTSLEWRAIDDAVVWEPLGQPVLPDWQELTSDRPAEAGS